MTTDSNMAFNKNIEGNISFRSNIEARMKEGNAELGVNEIYL